MLVSKIERISNKHSYDLYIDNDVTVRVHEEVLVQFGLRTGDAITDETLHALQSAEEFVLAKRKALEILGRRIRSEKELRDKLRNKEFHPHIISKVVTYLMEVGILDDARFARTYANHILSRKPAGKALLQRELRLKGIKSSLINDVITETFKESNEHQLAMEAAQKILNRSFSSTLDLKKRQQKLAGHLARRGFSWQIIYEVMRTLASENLLRTEVSTQESEE